MINSGAAAVEDIFNGPDRIKFPTLGAALAEKVYAAGMERNGDIVKGAAYAPGLGSVVSPQWTPNMINFNPGAVSLSTSYLTQQMLAKNRIANILSVQAAVAPETSKIYHSIGEKSGGSYSIKLINYNGSPKTISIKFAGGSVKAAGSNKQTFNSGGVTNLQASINFSTPTAVATSTGPLAVSKIVGSDMVQLELGPYTFTVVSVGGSGDEKQHRQSASESEEN